MLNRINELLTKATKARDLVAVSTLRMLKADILNKCKVNNTPEQDLPEEEIIKIIKSSIKKHLDSIEMFKKGGREELALVEHCELVILKSLLPEELSEEETEKIINEIDEPITQQSFGKIMGMLKSYPNMDMQIASKILKSKMIKN